MKLKHLVNHTIRLSLSIACLWLLHGCDKARVYEHNHKIADRNWSEDFVPEFNVVIDDTVQYYNMYINVRNADNYRFSNLYLFITTTLPYGQVERDTVQLLLADERGKWLGNGLGDIFECRILFKEKFRFINKGSYTIKLEQAMRLNPLPGILDVGIRIEKAE